MCQYCHTDVEGYSTYLPRIGTGNAVIRFSAVDGPLLDISGPNRTHLAIKITHCPMCGEQLKKEEAK